MQSIIVSIILCVAFFTMNAQSDPAPFTDFPDAFNEQIHENEVMPYSHVVGQEVLGYIRAAQQQDNAQGLTVVSQFYQDSIDAFTPIVPWLFAELDKITISPLQHAVTTVIVAQFYNFAYMCERLTELRAVKPLSVTGNEHNLINRLKTLETRVVAAVENSKGKGLAHGNSVWAAYLDKINAFLNAEFPKLNQAIGNLPSAALREKTIQQLIIDLTHLVQMPFML